MNHHGDAGHGGPRNKGTPSLIVMPEKDWVLDIDERLYACLRSFGHVGRSRSRSHDQALSQGDRARASALAGAHVVTSIHVNASVNPHASGVEVYHRRNDIWSPQVASAIVDAFPVELRHPRRRPRVLEAFDDPNDPDDDWEEHPQAIVEAHAAAICVLVEVGYGTNHHDRQILLSEWGRWAIVAGLLAGVARGLELMNQEGG